jgi:hypothetical protein
MKKIIVNMIVLISLISLFSTFTPNVFSQPENVEVLSYSWYEMYNDHRFIIVGEVQNVGPNIIDFIGLRGVVYTKDDQFQAITYRSAYSEQIMPQQKAPFQMYVYAETSEAGNLDWISIGVDHVAFAVLEANETDDYQYQDLEIISDSHSINSTGYYTVTGNLRNTGDQAAGKLWVVATFYNATGDVIAAGFSHYLDPDSLPPGQTTSFTVTPFDAPTQLSSQITDYALVIQTQGPIIPEFPSFLIIPLFMAATLVAVTVYRRRLTRKD